MELGRIFNNEVPKEIVSPEIVRTALSSVDSPECADLHVPVDTNLLPEMLANATVDRLAYEQVGLLSFHQRNPIDSDNAHGLIQLETRIKSLDPQAREERATLKLLGIDIQREAKVSQQVTTFYNKYLGRKEQGLDQSRLRIFANDFIATCYKPFSTKVDVPMLKKRLDSATFINSFGDENTVLLIKNLILTQGLLMSEQGRKAIIDASQQANVSFSQKEQSAFEHLGVYLRAEKERRKFFDLSTDREPGKALGQITRATKAMDQQIAEGMDEEGSPLMGENLQKTLSGPNKDRLIRYGNHIYIPSEPKAKVLAITDLHGSDMEYVFKMYGVFESWERGERFIVINMGDKVDRGTRQGQLLHTDLQLIEHHADSYISLVGDHEDEGVKHDLGKYLFRMYATSSNIGMQYLADFSQETINPLLQQDLGLASKNMANNGLSVDTVISYVKNYILHVLQKKDIPDFPQDINSYQEKTLQDYAELIEEKIGRQIGGTKPNQYRDSIYNRYLTYYKLCPTVANLNGGVFVHAGPPLEPINMHDTDLNPVDKKWGDPLTEENVMRFDLVDKEGLEQALEYILESSNETEIEFGYGTTHVQKWKREELEHMLSNIKKSGDVQFNEGRSSSLGAIRDRIILYPESHVDVWLDALIGQELRREDAETEEEKIGVMFKGHLKSENEDLSTRYLFNSKVVWIHTGSIEAPGLKEVKKEKGVPTVAYIADSSKPMRPVAMKKDNVVRRVYQPSA